MSYQYHNSLIGVGTVFLLSLLVAIRIPYLSNIGIFVLAIGSTLLILACILDLNGMQDGKSEVVEKNKKLNLAPLGTAKVHRIILVISTLMVAARGGLFFLLAALMAITLICGWLWSTEIRKLQAPTES